MAMQIIDKLSAKNKDAFSNPPVTIGFLGDSVTNGCFEVQTVKNASGGEDYHVVYEPEHSYSAHVRRLLSMLYPKAQINIVNAGISGDTAPGGLYRIDRDLLPFHPDLTVVCFGLNDSGLGDAGIEQYQKALHGIIRRLKETGSEVILMTPQPVCTYVHNFVHDEYLRDLAKKFVDLSASGSFDRYMNAAREAALQEQVPLCDVYAKWIALYQGGVDITELLSNYINHPTREMTELFAWSLVHTMFGV